MTADVCFFIGFVMGPATGRVFMHALSQLRRVSGLERFLIATSVLIAVALFVALLLAVIHSFIEWWRRRRGG